MVNRPERSIALLALPLLAAGCGDLFDVDNPTNIVDEELEDPQFVEALSNSPEGAFSLAYDNLIVDAALPTDEGWHFSSRTEHLELNQGTFLRHNDQTAARWNSMSQARFVAEDARERLKDLVDNPESHEGVAFGYYYGALARVKLADHYEEVPIDGGPPMDPDEAIEGALNLFERAYEVASAAGNDQLAAGALGSKARALRSLYFERGEEMTYFEQAAQEAQRALNIDPEYRVDVRYQTPGTSNSAFTRPGLGSLYDGMHPRFADREDPVSGVVDPRIQHTELLDEGAHGLDYYEPLKYPNRDTDIPASRWEEARLVLAEYYIVAGDTDEAVAQINIVRDDVGLPEFESDDADEVFEQLQYERSTEFWWEARRWQDMRYWGIIPPDWTPANQEAGLDRRWRVSPQEHDANEHM